jgi:hypothetical protein
MKLLEKKYRDKIDNVIYISKHKAKPLRKDCLIFSQRDWNLRLLIRINRIFLKINYSTFNENGVNSIICSPRTFCEIITDLEGFSYVNNFDASSRMDLIQEQGKLFNHRVFVDYSKPKRNLLLETKHHVIYDDKVVVFNGESKVGGVISIDWGYE